MAADAPCALMSPASPRPVPAAITPTVPVGSALGLVQCHDVLAPERRQAERSRFEVVDQPRATQIEELREVLGVEGPAEVDGQRAPVSDGPGNAEAGSFDLRRIGNQKASHDGLEALEIGAEKYLEPCRLTQLVVGEERESGVRSANVTGEDHAASLACGADR